MQKFVDNVLLCNLVIYVNGNWGRNKRCLKWSTQKKKGGGDEHVETFDTEDEMKRFIAESNVRPLFHYVEKEPK